VLLWHLPKRAIVYLCLELKNPIISFKGAYYSKDIILHAYVRYDFFRDLEEILEKMGVIFDHAQCLSSNKDTQRRSKQLT